MTQNCPYLIIIQRLFKAVFSPQTATESQIRTSIEQVHKAKEFVEDVRTLKP